MASEDISRSAFYSSKRYRGVRMQQGRVLTDDDWNSQDDIAADDLRWTRVHVIGPAGSPDDGYRIGGPAVTGDGIDFEIAAGTYYVAGHRVTLPEPIRYSAQPDWLDMPAAERTPPDGRRTDFAYLEVWEQPVTAVEDEELFEKALGGPDTTTRRRLMARIRLLPGVSADDCHDAWTLLGETLADRGTLDPSGELVPDLSLEVSYGESGDPTDLCTPSVTAGYLGAENQAIRVQLMDGALVWGFDAAAPPYRATIDAAGQVVTFLTQPRDAAHWPLAGQTIEILRPVAALANSELLADIKGHLTTVASSYDPSTGQVTITTAHPDGAALAALDHVYVRMWRRGTDLAGSAATPVSAGTAIPLGATGVTVTVQGSDLAADAFWIVAVRPETPDQVVPWELETGRAPLGVRRFYAPIGMLRWQPGGAAEVEDCRPTFAPLTAQRGCCRYTVGDGHTSHGQFRSIQAAIEALPPTGGEICLLPGSWEENLILDGLRDVVIHGCGARSQVTARDPRDPTVAIRGGRNIRLESFAIANPQSVAVEVRLGGKQRLTRVPDRIALVDLDIDARDRAAVLALAVFRFTLADSRIRIHALERDIGDGDVGAWPAVYLLVRDARVEGNRIETEIRTVTIEAPATGAESRTGPARTALGGIQLAGDSQRVDVIGNHIIAGLGNGITLGSVEWVQREQGKDLPPPPKRYLGKAGKLIFIPPFHLTDCCPEIKPDPFPPPPDEGEPPVPVSAGDLEDIRILDNRIERMGSSGIGVARFFPADDDFDLVWVERLSIERNRIHDCLWLEITASSPEVAPVAGWGGIGIGGASELVVRGNRITGNGAATTDPSCGVFALLAEHLTLEDNHIVDNGRQLAAGDPARPGPRGGVVLVITQPGVRDEPRESKLARDDGRPAARLNDNVIHSPDGPALHLNAFGPVAVHGNHFSALGRNAASARALAEANDEDPDDQSTVYYTGLAVRLFNFGWTHDILDIGTMHVSGDELEWQQIMSGGETLFNDNQVLLDLRGAEQSLVNCAVAISTLDDAGVDGNQLSVEMAGESQDTIMSNLIAVGITLRVGDNRFKERRDQAQASAVTFGGLNSTTDNQGTHCFLILGPSAGRVDQPNRHWSTDCHLINRIADRWNSQLDAGAGLSLGQAWNALFATEAAKGPFGRRKLKGIKPRPPRYNLDLMK